MKDLNARGISAKMIESMGWTNVSRVDCSLILGRFGRSSESNAPEAFSHVAFGLGRHRPSAFRFCVRVRVYSYNISST